VPDWLTKVLKRIRARAFAREVMFTLKALRGACRPGSRLGRRRRMRHPRQNDAADSARRLKSTTTGEWMYVFKPRASQIVLYIKLIIRSNCVVISFHEDASDGHQENEWAEGFRNGPQPHPARYRLPELRDDNGREAGDAAAAGQRRGDRGSVRCPKCGDIILGFQDSKRLREDAIAIYRKKYGLLSADEIRAIRDRFALTQADLARLLRLGANTVSRWESGRNVQTAAMDMLLRLIRDLPGSIDYLRNHAA
jgi:putative zinc finger/helix-turn-helix YgiT family protein